MFSREVGNQTRVAATAGDANRGGVGRADYQGKTYSKMTCYTNLLAQVSALALVALVAVSDPVMKP